LGFFTLGLIVLALTTSAQVRSHDTSLNSLSGGNIALAVIITFLREGLELSTILLAYRIHPIFKTYGNALIAK